MSLRQRRRQVQLDAFGTERALIFRMMALRARLQLWIDRVVPNQPLGLHFTVDSGANYTLINYDLACAANFHFLQLEQEFEFEVNTARGRTPMIVRPGRIRCWWTQNCLGYPFDWPVLFRVNSPPGVPSLLGLGGIVTTCSWHFDASYDPESPFGYLSLEDTR